MKICLLSYRGNPYCGGQGVYVMYLAKELVKQGHDVHMVVGPPYPFEMEGVTVHEIDNHMYFNHKGTSFIRKDDPFATLKSPMKFYEFVAAKLGIFSEIEAFSFRSFKLLKKLHKIHNFDVIHDNQCLGYGFLLTKLIGVPLISTIHHPLTIDRATWFEYPSSFFLKVRRMIYYPLMMQSFVSKRMDKIITVSHDSAVTIHRDFKIPKEKISVVYNGLDTNIFNPIFGVKRKENTILFVGNVEDRKKGIIYLLKALTLTKHPVNLIIVDGGAPNRNFVPSFIDRFGLNSRVKFTGKISTEKLLQLYSEATIGVTPSLYEGFGFPAAEAMACNLPIISSTGGALPEVVGNHLETGYLVEPRDSEALAVGIDYLLDNPDVRKKLVKNGRKRIEEIFTWENATKELVEVYKEVIDANS